MPKPTGGNSTKSRKESTQIEKTTEGNPEELPDGALEPEVTTDETAGAAGHDAGLPRDGTNAEHHGSEAKNKNGEDDSRDTENWQIPATGTVSITRRTPERTQMRPEERDEDQPTRLEQQTQKHEQ